MARREWYPFAATALSARLAPGGEGVSLGGGSNMPRLIETPSWFAIRSRYNREFIEELKQCAPIRAWDAATKSWLVPAASLDVVLRLCKKHYPYDDTTVERAQKPAATKSIGARPRDILGVSPRADQSEVKEAYRRLALALHPDRGGSHELFVLVQNAYDSLK